MDTKKESRIPECGNVPDLTGAKTVVGAKQLKKAVEAGRARYVFLAENADPAVIEPIVLLCRSKEVQTCLGSQYGRAWPCLRYRGGRGGCRRRGLILVLSDDRP